MRNVSDDKSCREHQNPYFMYLFLKSCLLWDNVEKILYSRTDRWE